MKWNRARRSSNVIDRRGGTAKKAGGLGVVGIIVVLAISYFTGQNPMQLLGLLNQGAAPGSQQAQTAPPKNDQTSAFISSILGETEDVWSEIFRASGSQYQPPKLVLFSGSVTSACGRAGASSGPFYCPGDRQMYIDTSFFNEMRTRMGGGGDFAEAYVIAHEVGHHIQTLTGVSGKVSQMRRSGANVEGAEGPLVRLELQADCYAGVWGHKAQQRHGWLEPGDIEEALNTASAIGDDRLQRQAGRNVMPDSFTHGSSAQRVRWFKIGFETGDAGQCDTFAAGRL